MLKLYNSMSRAREPFSPREEGTVKIFTCGPSTYRRPHIGNYRTFLYEDILVRYLEYLGHDVQRIINFTDVEDKMLEEAVQLGRNPEQIAEDVEVHFRRETELLGIKLPPEIPRASTSVAQAVRLIQQLIDKGYAYWHEGNVFFDPLKFSGFGKLYRLDMSRWPEKKVRFKRDTYNGNRWNRGDFILWHGHKEGDLSCWDTEIGRGRPSWNIQDPAMITKHLGFEIDINCGGIDNIYRHHDYNIAIIESLSGRQYASFYMHGAHLIVDGKTMSKSRGNIRYPEDMLEGGIRPYHLRYFLIHRHYRRKLNLTESSFRAAAQRIESIRERIRKLREKTSARAETKAELEIVPSLRGEFEKQMNEDLAVGQAVEALDRKLRNLEKNCYPLSRAAADHLVAELRDVDTVTKVLLED